MAVRDIAIIGATGQQGGGLARAILADGDGEFAVRAVTRHPASENARRLAKLGPEVVEANLDDERSLHAAFGGACGAYVVTDFLRRPDSGKIAAAACGSFLGCQLMS